MTEYVLGVPSSQKSDDWFNFVNKSLEDVEGVDILIVDFNNVSFLDTDDFVVLACLIESFYINGAKITFTGGTYKLNNHLFNVKFKSYWEDGFDRSKFTVSHNHSTLCLWKISQDMIYTYSLYAKQYFQRFKINKDLTPLASNIDEVFNNIFDHSKSLVSGYIITQFYQKNNKLSFSVCDFGVGIPASVQGFDDTVVPKHEDWKAILKSLEKGFSIKSTPRNRGFGLHNILEFTETSNGRLLIISNNGIVEKHSDKNYNVGSTTHNFKGTLIKVEIDLEALEDKEENEEIFDF